MTRLALHAALGGGIIGLLAFRLHGLRIGTGWAVGLPVALTCGAGAWLAWWLRRHWVSRHTAAASLDRALSLQQRLVTAEEVAARAQVPSLYPLLVDDVEQRLSGRHARLPPAVDRSTVALALVLLALLFWPLQEASRRQVAAISDKGHGTRDTRDATRQDGQSTEHTADGTQHKAQSTQQSAHSTQKSDEGHGTSDTPGRTEHTADGTQQPATSRRHTAHSTQEAARTAATNDKGQATRQSAGAKPSVSHTQEQSLAQGRSSGTQDALKADIQELLKELQGELQQLQTQLASHATGESHPEAGTGTDPELYGDMASLEPSRGAPLALQLPTDAAPTQASRRGSGVGTPSGEVSRQGPQASPDEAATLSDQPLEEQPQARAPIPPEYRDVFKRLSTRGEATSEAAPR